MKERKETIDLVKANLVSVGILLVAAIVFYSIFFMLWDYHVDADYLKAVRSRLHYYDVKFMVVLIVGIVVHELIHGVTFAIYAKSGFKSIRFGVMWKMLTPYCHCSEPLKVSHYVVGTLMPLVLLGIVPAIVTICIKSLFWLTMALVFVAMAAGDIMVVWKLRKENRDNMILDHPTEAGYLVYEED